MAHNESRRIYRSHRTVKIIAGICISLVVLFLVLFIFLFFYFQRYIVPAEDGVRLEVPWMEKWEIPESETETTNE